MVKGKREGTVYSFCSTCHADLIETPDKVGVKLTDWWIVRGICGKCREGVLLRARFAERIDSYHLPEPKVEVPAPPKKKPILPKQIGRLKRDYHSRPGLNNWSITAKQKMVFDKLSERWQVELVMVEGELGDTKIVCKRFYYPALAVPFCDYYLIPGV